MTPGAPVWRFSLGRLAQRAMHERKRLLLVHLLAAGLSVALVLLLPRWYRASVTLVPAPHDGLSLDLTGGAPIAGAMFGLGTGPTPQDQLRAVVRSRAVSDTLVNRFRLRARWNVERQEQARRRLAEHTTITTPREGEVQIEVEARDAVLARDLADGYARAAAEASIRLKSSLAAQRRLYLERRMADVETELARATSRLRAFEEQHRALSLPDQARETMQSYGALRAQRALLQTELAAARRWYAESAPEVQTLRDRVQELDRQVSDLAAKGGPLEPGGEELPALREQYLGIAREVASVTAVAELLRRAREQARVEEANPVPAFSVLDAAEVPERHSRPQRTLTVALSLLLCASASVAWLWWTDPARHAGDAVNTRRAA